jgi:hypothetical protein
MVDTVPGASRDGLLRVQQRSTTYLSMIPDFHRIENGETDDLKTALQKLRDARVCPSI